MYKLGKPVNRSRNMPESAPTPAERRSERSLSTSDVNKMNKSELLKVVKDLMKKPADPSDQSAILIEINTKLDVLMQKMTELEPVKEELRIVKTDVEELKTGASTTAAEVGRLNNQVVLLAQCVEKQQAYLEKRDADERANNLVVTGISETVAIGQATDDVAKVEHLLKALGCDDQVAKQGGENSRRIGKVRTDYSRPIIIRINSKPVRTSILDRAKTLNTADPTLRAIRIKRDRHPAVRREWKRLFDVKTAEREKPENAGITIEVNKKERTVVRDGVVIDSWKPSFFI